MKVENTQEQHLEDLGLSENLIFQLRNLIDGNQIRGDELKEISHKIYETTIRLGYVWTFEPSIRTNKIAGGSSADIHFGRSEYYFDEHTNKICNIIQKDKSLRTEFLGQFVDNGHNALLAFYKSHTIKYFDTFSYSYDCYSCDGNGYTKCTNCRDGKVNCSYCDGSGRIKSYRDKYYQGRFVERETVYNTCYNCFGSGKNTCQRCGGTTRVKCSSCGGAGYFTEYRHITAIAKPSYAVDVSSEQYGDILKNFLSNNTLEFIVEHAHFELILHNGEKVANKEGFIYDADNFITELTFEIQDKQYTCVAFANPPYAFVRPPIFDDIFADELALIAEINEDGIVTASEAYKFFNKYQGQPILDKAMVEIAQTRKSVDADTSAIIHRLCNRFVGDEVAKTISAFLNQCIDKVSPAYSKWTWIIGTFIFCVIACIGVEMWTEHFFKESIIWTTISTFGVMLGVWLIWAFILWSVSSSIVMFKRRKIPKEYRQKMRNSESYKMANRFALSACILGAICGYLAIRKSNITESYVSILQPVKEEICRLSKENQWHTKIDLESVAKFCPIEQPKKQTKTTKKKTQKSQKNSSQKNR